MKLFKIHKDIEIDKRFGNVRISTFKYSKPIENSDKWEHYTEVSCWYDNDCENCPCGWETRSYEGECDDCGCLFDRKGGFDVPTWKCMLPKWIKRLFAKHKEKECPFYKGELICDLKMLQEDLIVVNSTKASTKSLNAI